MRGLSIVCIALMFTRQSVIDTCRHCDLWTDVRRIHRQMLICKVHLCKFAVHGCINPVCKWLAQSICDEVHRNLAAR